MSPHIMSVLDGHRVDVDAAVAVTPGIDPWCSRPEWVVPASVAFAPESEALVIGSDAVGHALLARYLDPDAEAHTIAGMEPLWGFACPILTTRPEAFAEFLVEALADDPSWDRIVLPGFPDDVRLLRTIGEAWVPTGLAVGAAMGITRHVGDLEGGYDKFLSRRSSSFRRNLRNGQRRAEAAGITFENVSDEPDLFTRLQTIEAMSWKGLEGDGICGDAMAEFYRMIIAELQPQGQIRATVARRDGVDVGFILGGLRDGRYRGLQLSYATSQRALSLSHLLQAQEIETLCQRGVTTYDLCMAMDYKQRWADRDETSLVLVIERP